MIIGSPQVGTLIKKPLGSAGLKCMGGKLVATGKLLGIGVGANSARAAKPNNKRIKSQAALDGDTLDHRKGRFD